MTPILVGALTIGIVVWSFWESDLSEEVLEAAIRTPDGGGYSGLTGSGVSKPINFKNIQILPAAKDGRYCCGFTLEVFMEVANRHGLLNDREPWEIAQLQKEWYGIPKHARWRQMVEAMERVDVGHEVSLDQAKAGDFALFSRPGSGHSVILLGVVRRGDEIVGIKYRSAQPSTQGVGDCVEYFLESGIDGGSILLNTLFVGRLTG
ncbi:MAG: hypothetical protein WBD40_22420 [Tepidisphaeraceae bacterium]